MHGKVCPLCGKGNLKAQTGEFHAPFERVKGSQEDLVVPNLTWFKCDNCGEELLDDRAAKAVSEAQRSALGLLSAAEIKAFRENLGKTQMEMSKLLGVGEKTFCRWESGEHLHSESSDRYLRLLMIDPAIVECLEAIASAKMERRVSLDFVEDARQFPYLDHSLDVSSFEQSFVDLLITGQLQAQAA